ncbi:hypothetical protein ACBJ59_10355 [Nonomuraea sp. MTCD27]|uniref:hypothetical protein n=1 Tax=Nonomuraea sp. MTCD27 TaxID=1676747 RepID=UPI0035C1C522
MTVDSGPGSRFDRVTKWMLFILPTLCGFLMWRIRDHDPYMPILAVSAWGCGTLYALLIVFDHYRRPPGGR